jgi:cell division protein FtsX
MTNILETLVGLGLTAFCVYGIWSIVNLLLNSFSTHDAWMLVGGGILAYLFGGLLVAGAVIGFCLIVDSLEL